MTASQSEIYLARHAKATEKLEALQKQKITLLGKRKVLEVFIRDIEKSEQVITDFDEELWASAVESVTVELGGELTFKFRNGREVRVLG